MWGHSDIKSSSVFAIKLELPCSEAEWTAIGALEWDSITTPPLVGRMKCHEIHHAMLSAKDAHDALPPLDALSAYLLLSGVASIALDSLQRLYEPMSNKTGALNHLANLLHPIHDALNNTPESTMKRHGHTIFYITVISLSTPLDLLERAANSGYSRTGLTSKQQTRLATVRLLTKSKVRLDTARHALRLLRIYLPSASNLSSPYESSGLYIGALALWAYIIGQDGDERSTLPSESSDLEGALNAMEYSIDSSDMMACGKHWRTIVQHAANRLAVKLNENSREYSEVLRSLIDMEI